MRTKFKKWAVDYLNESQNIFDIEEKDKIIEYLKLKPTFLEIGPGKGKFIIDLAKKFPEYNYLVVEINQTVAGIGLKNIDDQNLTNVKMIADDFYKLVDILPNESFEGIFLNFSDPWPKKRHAKRRLTSDLFLINYGKILKKNHKIYMKTDNDGLYEYSKENFLKYGYELEFDSINYKEEHEFDALTEFESKYLLENIKIKKMILNNGNNVKTELIKEGE